MRILHIMLSAFYVDHYSYQENLLPKYHKSAGHDVRIIASLFSFDENGNGMWLPKPSVYTNEHGIRVSRLAFQKGKTAKQLRRYCGLREELDDFRPQIIFIHGVQFCDIGIVAAYAKKHPDVRVFCDNHADFGNSAKGFLSRKILHGIIWKHCAKKIEPYTEKFYGVLPARVDFLKDVYGLPAEKCELLVMGADDELVEAASKPEVRTQTRARYGISEGASVVMAGGKIDSNKPQIIDLMRAVNQSGRSDLLLLVFGSVVPDLREAFDAQLSDKVKYIGWKKSDDIYGEFAAADIIAFPGLHSVLWEQAVAMGKPCVFRKIPGAQHIDLSGNCMYFTEDTPEAYLSVLLAALEKRDQLEAAAKEKGMKHFSYRDIARRAIGQ